MRWSIVRHIWMRELRDQLRDRRTIFMIAVLPVLLYPVAGFGVMQLAVGFLSQKSVVGVAGTGNLEPWHRPATIPTPAVAACTFALTPAPPGCPMGGVARLAEVAGATLARDEIESTGRTFGWLTLMPALGGVERIAGAAALTRRPLDYPPLLERRDGRLAIVQSYVERGGSADTLLVRAIPTGTDADYRAMLDERKVDLVVVVPADFQATLFAGGVPDIHLHGRDKDESAKLVTLRVGGILDRWHRDLREVRLARLGLRPDFDRSLRVHDPERAKTTAAAEGENLFNLLVKVFPFILVMWSLAGALYPAVDICAGEKERGTMETLLISPASREEIVWGKFLTIWLFSTATALLNLLSMAVTTSGLAATRPEAAFRIGALVWGVVLLLPLSAFFSALCLAVGAYARSSKEGQYYLMPLFLLTMPLIFLTLAPGVELNPFYCMVPVTGVALLLQKVVAEKPDWNVGIYFVPVLVPMVVYSWLALRWAISLFKREEVLFREAERLDIGLWLRRLLRDKEALPSAGEAVFCFVCILALRWVSFGVGNHLSLLTRTGISQLAFVATPPLFMALLLTTRPRLGLALTRPPSWGWPAAVGLACLVMPPLAMLTSAILAQFPALKALLELEHPLTSELSALAAQDDWLATLPYFLVLAVLPAICEELAFRGFILMGLLRAFRPFAAVLVSAFLFSLYQMNVFQFAPHFVFGVVLGILVVRTGSVLPAIAFHLVYNGLLFAPVFLPGLFGGPFPLRLGVSGVCGVLAVAGVAVVWRKGDSFSRNTVV
jgi:sodium transport system permease protein